MSLRRFWPIALLGLTAAFYVALNAVQIRVFGPPWGPSAAPDLRLTGYTSDQVRVFLATIGDEGRAVFFGLFRQLDTVFPPLLALSLLVLFRALRRGQGGVAIAGYALLPLAYLVADLSENRFLTQLSATRDFDGLVQAASRATQVKYGALALALMVLAGLALRGSRKKGAQ